MSVHRVVPGEESLAMCSCIFDATEAIREVGPIFERLELRLGVRIVIGDMRTAVALGYIKVDQQGGHGFGSHAGAAVGVQGEAARGDVLLGGGVGDQLLGQLGGLARGDHPADDVAAEDIQDQVQMEVRPLSGASQLGDVPGPHFVGLGGRQLRLGVDRGWVN